MSALDRLKELYEDDPLKIWTYSELARQTGVSRQRIYQLSGRIKALGIQIANAGKGRGNFKINKPEPCPLRPTVYLLGCEDWCKVGYTENLTNRLSSLQTGCPFRQSLISAREFSSKEKALQVEMNLHVAFEKRSVKRFTAENGNGGREWFLIDRKTAISIFTENVEAEKASH